MKKSLLFFLLVLFLSLKINAQQDPVLVTRLNEVLKATQEMNIEKILDMSYPKLFKIAPRESVAEAMKGAFETDEFVTSLDSIKVEKIHPVFTIENASYAKIIHSMRMRMKFKNEMNSAAVAEMLPLMEEAYGKDKVLFDKPNNTFVIYDIAVLVAIKDEFAKEWCFVNYDEESELAPLLFSNAVIKKLKEYK